MERALSHVATVKAAEAVQAEAAEWRAASGPVSFVCGETEAAAWDRVEALRGLGMIQPVDKVHVLPLYPEFAGKQFLRFEMLGEHKDAVLAFLRHNRDQPGREPPPGWRSPGSASAQGA